MRCLGPVLFAVLLAGGPTVASDEKELDNCR
jgi:hypothetical protein